MRRRILQLLLVIIFINNYISVFSQDNTEKTRSIETILDSLKSSGVIMNDTRKKPEIFLSTEQAVKFLQQRIESKYWNNEKDPFRLALGQLIFEASHHPYDSSAYLLRRYPYDSLNIPWDKFYIWEPLRLKVPYIANTQISIPADSTIKTDTNTVVISNDTINISQVTNAKATADYKPVVSLKDTTFMVIIDTLKEVTSNKSGFPFKYLTFPFQGDSIQVAVKSLMKYLENRDSTVLHFTGVGNNVTPVWINSSSDKVVRYWLRNEFSDSVTVWIGNPSKDTIGLYLEQGISFRRPVKQGNYSDARINVQSIDNSKLLNVQKIVVKPQYWKCREEASFILNQASLTNWVRGGENSISTAIDVTGYADYSNKALKLSSNNFARLKLGFLKSGDNPIRKNLDLLETNSKLNHKAFGKFDFSGILLFKTQLTSGFDYFKTVSGKDTSRLVSKFMNPAILTIGFGLDYKPNKTTSINFSPLSYKATFVTDTANIDQTKYGIQKNRKSLHEPGISFMVSNECKLYKFITVTNRLQLFTNYVHNPQNIDVDWEMIGVASLNWFTDIRINTHLIFDDDTRTVELDKSKNPVLRPDGTQKKTARIQFKEMIGLSLVFRF
jgi:hypothetical protein